MRVPDVLESLGGFATRDELIDLRCSPEMIDLTLYYRKILRVRRGQYASVGTPPEVLGALRVGGRLACVSALDYYERERGECSGRRQSSGLHVLVRYGSSRLHIASSPGIVLHWSRRKLGGSRTVVSEQVAREQAANCRSLLGSGGVDQER